MACLTLFSCKIDDRTVTFTPVDSSAGDDGASSGNDVDATTTSTNGDDAGDAGDAGDASPAIELTDASLGASCSSGGQCATGHCVDGVCCESSCADSCNACNVSGSEGMCVPVPANDGPASGHPACQTSDPTTCGFDGVCDGTGFCQKYPSTTVCGPETCTSSSNTFIGESKCDGMGSCVTPNAQNCAPYTCNGNACYGTCGTAGGPECSTGNTCTNHSCGLKSNGAACTTAAECNSNVCVDGYCCNVACGSQCQACDVPPNPGVCTTVASGAPHGKRAACTNPGTVCGGQCTTSSATACTYPGGTTSCRTQSCTSAVETLGASCSGTGTCPAVSTQNCTTSVAHATAACSGTACGGFTCDNYHTASGNTCVAKWTAETTAAYEFFGISGTSATDIYAIGGIFIYHSKGDGTWTQVYTTGSQTNQLDSIWADAYDPSFVYASGNNNIILESTNAGSTWTQIPDPNGPTDDTYNVVAGNGYGLGAGEKPFVFFFGENTWTVLDGANGFEPLAANSDHPIYGATVTSSYAYYFAGDATGELYGSNAVGTLASNYTASTGAIYGMWNDPVFSQPVMAVGAGGGIYYATSCPTNTSTPYAQQCNWTKQTSGTTQDLHGVYAFNAGASMGMAGPYTYYAVGNGGTILTSTGNGTWTAVTSNTTAGLTGVWMASAQDIFASASNGTVMHFNGP